jgi:hypothetical protein
MSSKPAAPFSLNRADVAEIIRGDDLAYQSYKEMKQAMSTLSPCPDGNGAPCLSCYAEVAGVVMALRLKTERADRRLAE